MTKLEELKATRDAAYVALGAAYAAWHSADAARAAYEAAYDAARAARAAYEAELKKQEEKQND